MTDTRTVGSPVLGRVDERLGLVPYLRRLIHRRNTHLRASLGAGVRYVSMTAPADRCWPTAPSGYRRYERTTVVGTGDAAWSRASADLLRWGVKTRSGFVVSPGDEVAIGDRPIITARAAGLTIRAPAEVVDVVREPDCGGLELGRAEWRDRGCQY